jgi:hypothetical protein
MTTQADLLQIRARADALGVSYHHMAGVPKIQKAIDLHLEAMGKEQEAEDLTTLKVASEAPVPKVPEKMIVPKSGVAFRAEQVRRNKLEANRLVRCVIQCMDPQKREWPGELFSVGSAKLGTFKKYVPYNSEPYHIPKIIYDMLTEKKCSVFYNAIGDKGHKTRKSRLIPAYSIQVLDPLTPAELKTLSVKQALAQGKEA